MGSEIQGERAKQAQELRDLQDTYRKRRQAVVDEGEAELEKARKETSGKVREETNSGAAAINHVRSSNREKLVETKEQGESQLTYEKRALGKQLQNTRQSGADQNNQIAENVAAKQEGLQKNLGELNKREAVLRTRENEITGNLQKEQAVRRDQIQKTVQGEIAELDGRMRQKKTEVREKSDAELRKEIETNRAALKQQRDNFQGTYNKQNEMTQAQIKAQKEQHSKMSEAQRQEYNANLATLKARGDQALATETVEGQERLGEVQEGNKSNFELERNTGAQKLEQTRQHYTQEIAKVHKAGDAEVGKQTENHFLLINRLKEDEKAQVEIMQVQHEGNLKEKEALHKKQAGETDVYFKQALVEQKKEYDDAFQKNIKAFTDQVKLQKAQYMASAVKEKREVMQDIAKYSDKDIDPFYRLNHAKSELEETDTHYIVKAKVPEHERQNVKISVKDDKVIVNGQRRFEDKIKEEDTQISTNNYQTFREVIPLEHPVREKFVQQKWENGILTLRIPKA